MSARVPVTLDAVGGEYMETASVVEWLVAVGEPVRAGAPLVVVETAKAATEVAAPCDGVLAGIQAPAGSEIAVGAVLGHVVAGTKAPAVHGTPPHAAALPAQALSEGRTDAPSTAPADAPAQAHGARRFASPRARALARELGVDLATVTGSGPHGRVQQADVRAVAKAVPARREHGYRRAMAAHMARSAEVPQFSVSIDCEGTRLLAARDALKRRGGGPSPNDLLLVAVARVLRRCPEMNALWQDGAATPVAAINIGVAIATPRGLVVPVVHEADRLDWAAVAAETARLGALAKAGALRPEDVADATFTISNLAPYGVSEFRALVNPPQAAILAVPAFQPVLALADGRPVERQVVRLTITADHRCLDGAQVARFARRLKTQVEGFALATVTTNDEEPVDDG